MRTVKRPTKNDSDKYKKGFHNGLTFALEELGISPNEWNQIKKKKKKVEVTS